MRPLITLADCRTLLGQVRHPFEKQKLLGMLSRATITTASRLPANAVRLNSIVYLWHSLLRKVVRIRLVPPRMADLSRMSISAISPLGQAVFGYRENDTLRVQIGGMQKELKIIKVLNKNQ